MKKLIKKYNNLYTKYIIEGLQELFDLKRKQIFMEVYEKNYFKDQILIIQRMNINILINYIIYNIDNIYINVSNILNNDNINNID